MRGRAAAGSGALALLVVAAACTPTEGPGASVVVTDSAGVRIVTSRAPAWGEDEGWRPDAEPRLVLGSSGLRGAGDEGTPGEVDDVLFQRIVGVRLLSDGRVAVLDAGDGTLRIFTSEGRPMERWGGLGEGPAEFRGPAALLALPGDTLVVWDAPPNALVRIVPGDGIVRRTPLAGVPLVQATAPAIAADGRVVMPGFVWPPGSGEQDPGIYRGTAPVLVHAADGTSVDTLALRPARQIMVAEVMGRSLVGNVPFGADLHAVWVAPGRVAVGDGTAVSAGSAGRLWRVEVVDSTGLVEVIRGPAEELVITDDDRAWYLEQLAARATSPQEEAMLPQLERALTWPEVRPAWSGLRRDDTGHLWLRIGRHLPPTAPSTRWRIVSPDGVWLGDVEFPDGFEPMHLGVDEVAGVRIDALGVQRVQVYGLARGEG